MRKITQRERNNGMRWCTFCKPEKVRAIWRNTSLAINKREEKLCYSCDEHKNLLVDGTAPKPADFKLTGQHSEHSDYMTEADYQTWGKL